MNDTIFVHGTHGRQQLMRYFEDAAVALAALHVGKNTAVAGVRWSLARFWRGGWDED